MKKIISHLKWFVALIPVGLFAIITAPIIYPLAYLMEGINDKFNPLWWWLDDEIEDEKKNEDWLIYCNGNTKSFKHLYTWHAFRNTCWNLKESLFVPENARLNCEWNKEQIVEVIQDRLFRNKMKVSIYLNCIEMACYKWIDKDGNEGWQVNRGVKISDKFSTIGVSELWYTANKKLYYRYSIAKMINFIGNKYYFQFRMGASEKRYLLILKITKKEET